MDTQSLRGEAMTGVAWDDRLNGYVLGSDGKVKSVFCGLLEADPQPGEHYWKLVAAAFLDEDEAAGKHEVAVEVLNYLGQPQPGPLVEHGWPYHVYPGADTVVANPAPANFPLWSNYNPLTDVVGPYWVRMGGEGRSDVFYGMGLPGNRHVSYKVTFQRMIAPTVVEPPPDPPPPPPPPPDPEPDPVIMEQLENLWLMVNTLVERVDTLHGDMHEVLRLVRTPDVIEQPVQEPGEGFIPYLRRLCSWGTRLHWEIDDPLARELMESGWTPITNKMPYNWATSTGLQVTGEVQFGMGAAINGERQLWAAYNRTADPNMIGTDKI